MTRYVVKVDLKGVRDPEFKPIPVHDQKEIEYTIKDCLSTARKEEWFKIVDQTQLGE
jgi:hypothetical protein